MRLFSVWECVDWMMILFNNINWVSSWKTFFWISTRKADITGIYTAYRKSPNKRRFSIRCRVANRRRGSRSIAWINAGSQLNAGSLINLSLWTEISLHIIQFLDWLGAFIWGFMVHVIYISTKLIANLKLWTFSGIQEFILLKEACYTSYRIQWSKEGGVLQSTDID